MWRKSGTKLQGRYPATPSGGFMLGLDEFVYLAKSNLNLTIWLVQMHSKLASLVRNNIWTCQIVKFALDFAKNTNPSRPSINPPVGVAGSVLIYMSCRGRVSCLCWPLCGPKIAIHRSHNTESKHTLQISIPVFLLNYNSISWSSFRLIEGCPGDSWDEFICFWHAVIL